MAAKLILSPPAADYAVRGINGALSFHFEIGPIAFIAVSFVLGFSMSLGKAAVDKHIPTNYPQNGVFIHRSDSIYDDSPSERYQFPRQYLGRVEATVGDWIVYYEPRKVAETRGYFAVAKVERVIPDPTAAGMYLALIEPGSYLDFVRPVPFSDADGVIERGVLNEGGRISGRAQAAGATAIAERLRPHRRSWAGWPAAIAAPAR